MVIDFTKEQPWRSIDDVVMGGRSDSEMIIENGVAVFRGNVSLENGGGFASVRSIPALHDLSSFRALAIRVRGDGKRYRLRLRTTEAFDGVSYESTFRTGNYDWEEIDLPFERFEPRFRGRVVEDHPTLDTAEIRTFGLMISDRQEGPFRLEIAWISGSD